MIDAAFNAAIMEAAKVHAPVPFRLVDCYSQAPGTFDELVSMTERDGYVSAATQDGDYSIFGDPVCNAIFMGWHDGDHYRYRLGFNLAGEAMAGYLHLYQMATLHRYHPDMVLWGCYLLSRFIGQGVYYARRGRSPDDQQAFLLCNHEQFEELSAYLIHHLTSEEHALNEASNRYGNGHVPR